VEPSGSQPNSVLVLGGSSGVGAAAIQLLRLALSATTILTTSSPKHHAHLVSLGATKAFDRDSPSLVADILSTTDEGKGIDMIIDAVGSAATRTGIFDTLRADGPREYAQVFTGAQILVPDDVRRSVVFGRKLFDMPGGKNALSALTDLVSQQKYKLPIQVQKIGSGLQSIAPGLEQLKRGVSGTKLVITV
jgi:NADPH:quinone reductase-like Zn-dependent oxidoreductase